MSSAGGSSQSTRPPSDFSLISVKREADTYTFNVRDIPHAELKVADVTDDVKPFRENVMTNISRAPSWHLESGFTGNPLVQSLLHDYVYSIRAFPFPQRLDFNNRSIILPGICSLMRRTTRQEYAQSGVSFLPQDPDEGTTADVGFIFTPTCITGPHPQFFVSRPGWDIRIDLGNGMEGSLSKISAMQAIVDYDGNGRAQPRKVIQFDTMGHMTTLPSWNYRQATQYLDDPWHYSMNDHTLVGELTLYGVY